MVKIATYKDSLVKNMGKKFKSLCGGENRNLKHDERRNIKANSCVFWKCKSIGVTGDCVETTERSSQSSQRT